MEKPSIVRNTGGGGNEPQGRQGKPPINVGNNLTCHPELSFSLAQRKRKPQESETGWFTKQLCHPEFISGSCHRNIIPSPENIKNITFASQKAKRHVRGGSQPARAAFTLAEVLITLGIIGIVAAMTLPVLLAKYQLQVKTTRLKKFYTTFAQATLLAQNEYASIGGEEILTAAADPDQMYDYLVKYYKPYFNFAELKKTAVGVLAKFPDGSAFITAKSSALTAGTGYVHIIFCPESKYCESDDIINNVRLDNLPDGINRFMFYFNDTSIVPMYTRGVDEDGNQGADIKKPSRDEAIRACKVFARDCTYLLYMDNWEFKDDYPRK